MIVCTIFVNYRKYYGEICLVAWVLFLVFILIAARLGCVVEWGDCRHPNQRWNSYFIVPLGAAPDGKNFTRKTCLLRLKINRSRMVLGKKFK